MNLFGATWDEHHCPQRNCRVVRIAMSLTRAQQAKLADRRERINQMRIHGLPQPLKNRCGADGLLLIFPLRSGAARTRIIEFFKKHGVPIRDTQRRAA